MKLHHHKYKRMKLGKNGYEIYRCQLPACTHYINVTLAIGMPAVCWKCGAEFFLDQYSAARTKPKCSACITKKEAVA